MAARLGVQIELNTKQFINRIPSLAMRSLFGALLIRLPLAPMAWAAWSSPTLKHPFHFGHDLRVLWIVGQIGELARVFVVVVKLDTFPAIIPFGVTPAFCTHAAAHETPFVCAPRHLGIGRAVPAPLRIIEQ